MLKHEPNVVNRYETGTPAPRTWGTEAPLPAAPGDLDAVFAHCPTPVIRTDPNGIIEFLNPAALQVHGYTLEEVVGQHIAILTPEDMRAHIGELLAHVRQGGSFADLPAVASARDGSRLYGKMSVFGAPDATGQIIAIYGIISELGARPPDPPAEGASDSRFRNTFEDGHAARFMIDLDGQIMKVNAAACRLLGYREEDLCRLDVSHIWRPDTAGSSALTQLHALTGSPTQGLPMRLIPQHGHTLWARVNVSLLSDDAGTPLFMIASAEDLTPGTPAARETEALQTRLHEILDRLDYAYLEINHQWEVIKANAAWSALGGFTGDAIGRPLQEILPPADYTAFADQIQQVTLDREVVLFEEYYYAPTDRWLSVRVAPTPDGIGIFLRDVSQRRQLMEDLRLANLRLQILVDHAPAAIFILEVHSDSPRDDTGLYMSPYFEAMTGFPSPASGPFVPAGHWSSLLHPEERERVIATLDASMRESDQCTQEHRLACADGSYIWVQSVMVTVRDAANRPISRIGILTDITAMWEAEQTRIRLEAIVESADEVIYSLTPDGRIASWNAGAERITGYAPAVALGQTFAELFPEDDVPPFDLAAVQAAAGGLHTVAHLHRRDGAVCDLVISEAIMHSENGTLIGVSGVAQDVTALNAAEHELREALHAAEAGERSKAFFLSMMSHELRTPLQSVLGYAELLLSGGSGEITPTQAEDIAAICRGAHRMSSLLKRILDLSRLFGNQLELVSEAVDLGAICQDVARAFHAEAEARGLTITLTLQPNLPPVQGDAQRLRQILHNLVENAVKFTERGGINLTLRQRQNVVEAVVQDSGIGISRQDLPHIFEMFRQVDSRLSRRYEGAGLGLPLAQQLALLMGGDVNAASVLGEGSVFTLRLPV
ncbi:MAG: PAS domain S-box protein [Thermomicrobiales bacterium]